LAVVLATVIRTKIAAYFFAWSLIAVQAAKHQLFTSTYGTPFIYTVEFDDESNTLELLATTSVPAASQWLALSVSEASILRRHWIDKFALA